MAESPIDKYVRTCSPQESCWRSVVLFGKNTASYKFALAQSLLRLAQQGKSSVALEDLALPYARHICSHAKTAPRQSTNRTNKFLQACAGFNEGSVSESQLVDATVRNGFNYVLDAFHNVNGAPVPVTFFQKDFSSGSKRLVLTDEAFKLAASPQAASILQETESRWNLVETAWEQGISASLLRVSYDEAGQELIAESGTRRKPVADEEGVAYARTVKWGQAAKRDALPASSKNSLGGIQTIFSVSDDVMADLRAAAKDKPAAEHDDAEDEAADDDARAATYDNGIELIKDRVNQLEWEDMERLVAGLLKAMGYCARVMPKGPDGGRDVVASPDALGLESPRIVAEVKHRKGAMGAPAVRSFIGGLRAGDRGLYVSTGGFTKEARYEADRATVPVRLLNLDDFVRYYVEVYDKADDETRSILPLTRIWWPA